METSIFLLVKLHIILYCILLYHIILYSILLYYIVWYSSLSNYIIAYYIKLYYIILYFILYILLYYIILYYIILYYIISYYIILYHIIYYKPSILGYPHLWKNPNACIRGSGFQQILAHFGIMTRVRREMGQDIAGACGQRLGHQRLGNGRHTSYDWFP